MVRVVRRRYTALMRVAIIFTVLFSFLAITPSPTLADGRESLFGTWGTAAQCARKPLKPGGTVLAEPFLINDEWLRHGQLWCRLRWFPIENRENELFTGAFAQCGEDSVRSYMLRMTLATDNTLNLKWGLARSNGPLAICEAS